MVQDWKFGTNPYFSDRALTASRLFPELGYTSKSFDTWGPANPPYSSLTSETLEPLLQAQRLAEEAMQPLRDLQRSIDSVMSPLRDIQRTLSESSPDLKALKDLLSGPGWVHQESLRATRWLESIEHADALTRFEPLGEAREALRLQYERMTAVGSFSSSLLPQIDRPSLGSALATTQTKLSVVAGLQVVLGYRSPFMKTANAALLGTWATHPDLPDRFWENAAYRHDLYREADVDEGLVEAEPAQVLDLFVDSGFAAGFREGGVTTVAFQHVGLTVLISSGDIDEDASRMVRRFEVALREVVASKMHAAYGRDWMKKAPGQILARAKQAREKAYRGGEPRSSLVAFTHLGDLKEIVRQRDVWDVLFQPVFRNWDDFGRDIDRIISFVRNPNSHSRRLDGTRFLEIVRTIEGLLDHIADDGRWKEDANEDF